MACACGCRGTLLAAWNQGCKGKLIQIEMGKWFPGASGGPLPSFAPHYCAKPLAQPNPLLTATGQQCAKSEKGA